MISSDQREPWARFTCRTKRPAFTKRELWIFTAGYALGVALTTFIICLFVCRI